MLIKEMKDGTRGNVSLMVESATISQTKNGDDFYPNFPKEVMEASEVQLFVEQMAHYCFGYRPKGVDEKENIHSLEEHPLKVLMAIPNDEGEKHRIASEVFQNMFHCICSIRHHAICHIFFDRRSEMLYIWIV